MFWIVGFAIGLNVDFSSNSNERTTYSVGGGPMLAALVFSFEDSNR